MNGPEIISSVAADLELQLQHHYPLSAARISTTVSPGLAVALLQKSIRRGRTDLALAAANILQRAAPERLWRRLAVIAIEDVGLGDIDTVYITIVASAHWRRLARRFGDQRLVNLVVSRMTSAAKCRASDDLYVATADCPAWHQDRLELAELPFRDLLDVIAGDDPIERRAIAARYAIRTAGSSSAGSLARRRGHPDAVFDLLCEITPHTLAEVARSAYRQTGEPFCTFLPLLHQQFNGSETELRSDPLPEETIVGGIPGWAYDKFSREGRAALDRFLRADCATANWLRLHVEPGARKAVLGHAVFRVESGLVADRLIWRKGASLREQADLHSWPFPPQDAATLMALMRADIGILNRAREASHAL
jgi:hypothetical protein